MDRTTNTKRIHWAVWAFTAVAVLFIMAAVNYTVDPGKLFSLPASTELKAVEIIESGHGVENLDNYNERMVKRLLALNLGQTDVLVLGSSRAALITSEMAGTESFFNLSVAGAMLEETIGLYGLYYDNNGAPERIILTVDPWYLCEDHDSKRFPGALGDGYYAYATERMGMELKETDYEVEEYYRDPGSFSFWRLDLTTKIQLFSVTYFQSSVKTLFTGGGSNISLTDDAYGTFGILRSDGSYAYPEEYRSAEYATILSRSQSSSIIGEGTYHVSGGTKRAIFEAFINSLLEDGVDVDLVLVPLNPEIYERSKESGVPLDEIEDYFNAFAEEAGVDISGSYNAETLRSGYDDFYDAYHYRPDCVARLIARLGEDE